jgi:hypothetical protein
MAKNLSFWATIIGFLLGGIISLSDKLMQKLGEHVSFFSGFEYPAMVIAVPAVIGLIIIYHYVEKEESEKREHNETMLFSYLNNLSKHFESVSKNIEAMSKNMNTSLEKLTNEIRQERNERNNKP